MKEQTEVRERHFSVTRPDGTTATFSVEWGGSAAMELQELAARGGTHELVLDHEGGKLTFVGRIEEVSEEERRQRERNIRKEFN